MLKKFFLVLTAISALTAAYLGKDFFFKRTLTTPYPYSFTPSFDQKFIKAHAEEVESAQKASILIVGDRMANSLTPYQNALQEPFQKALKTPPSIFNWGAEGEGLFRTIYKLKTLKKLPPIIIYFGASSELEEQRFLAADKNKIFKNFATFDNEKLLSLIITFPWLSKILYEDIRYFDLEEPKKYVSLISAPQKLEEKEVAFKLFQYEVKELIDLVKNRHSHLIFITTPLNLEVPPKEVCAHATSGEIVALQREIEAHIKEGAFKTAHPKARELAQTTFSNAYSFYLLGQTALGVGDIRLARESFLKASVFDCKNWRGNAVYNAIIRNLAHKNLNAVVDFDQLMSSNLSSEGLYMDEIFPQNVFYQTMTSELGDILKKIWSVGE